MKTRNEFKDPYYRTSSQSPKTVKETAVNSELNSDTSFVEINQPAISTAEKTTLKPQSFQPSKVSAKVKDLKQPSFKLAHLKIFKRAYSNNSISEMYDMLDAYNLVGKIGVWMMLVGSSLITLTLTLVSFEILDIIIYDLGTFIIFLFSILIGLGLLILGFLFWAIGLAIFHWF